MKIIKYKSLGQRDTYSPEMKGSQHNYLTDSSGAVHRNSHGVSYVLVAFRCLFLKAHFAPEWWAAVMSDCKPDKLVRYMGVARSEPWRPTEHTNAGSYQSAKDVRNVKFDAMDINNLSINFTVDGDTIIPGIIGISGIGEETAKSFVSDAKYNSIEEFLGQKNDAEGSKSRINKTVLERFIKLGAFKKLPGHANAKALWHWYMYEHCSGKEITQFRKEIQEKLKLAQGWTNEKIEAEKERLTEEYRQLYPKRKKIPDAIVKFKPHIDDSRSQVMSLYAEDFTLEEKLEFQKEYLGYYIDSPLDLYKTKGKNTIVKAKEVLSSQIVSETSIDVIILEINSGVTKKDRPYLKLTVSDGVARTIILVWENEMINNIEKLKVNEGFTMEVQFDPTRNIFTLARGSTVRKLVRCE